MIDIEEDLKDPKITAAELLEKFGSKKNALLHVSQLIDIVGNINSYDGWCGECGAQHSGEVKCFFMQVEQELKAINSKVQHTGVATLVNGIAWVNLKEATKTCFISLTKLNNEDDEIVIVHKDHQCDGRFAITEIHEYNGEVRWELGEPTE